MDLAQGRKSFRDIKKLVGDVYGDKALKKTQIYEILKQVKDGEKSKGVHQAENQDDRRFNRLRRRRCRRRPSGEQSGPCQSPWDIVWHHQLHPAQPAWAGKEAGPVGPEAVVHTAKVDQEFLAKKKGSNCSPTPLPYSPDLAPADYFLFHQLKKELAGITMTQEEFKKGWESAGRSLRRPSCTSMSGAKSLFA